MVQLTNVTRLREKDVKWADYVFISAMSVQMASAREIIAQCVELKKKIVAGGPLFTEEYEQYPEVDHLILNEAEITLPMFLEDLENGKGQMNLPISPDRLCRIRPVAANRLERQCVLC